MVAAKAKKHPQPFHEWQQAADLITGSVTGLNKLWASYSTQHTKVKDKLEALAKSCAQLNDTLTPEQKIEVFEELKFDKSTFSKMSTIGANTYIWSPKIRPYLTGAYSLDYEIACWSNEQIDTAIKEGVLGEDGSSRKLIHNFKARLDDDDGSDVDDRSRVYASIKVPIQTDIKILDEIETHLKEIERLNDEISVVRPLGDFEEVKEKFLTKVNNAVRRQASKTIKGMPKGRRPTGERRKEIMAHYDLGNIKPLTELLRLFGSDFEVVKTEAYKGVKVPSLLVKWHEKTQDPFNPEHQQLKVDLPPQSGPAAMLV